MPRTFVKCLNMVCMFPVLFPMKRRSNRWFPFFLVFDCTPINGAGLLIHFVITSMGNCVGGALCLHKINERSTLTACSMYGCWRSEARKTEPSSGIQLLQSMVSLKCVQQSKNGSNFSRTKLNSLLFTYALKHKQEPTNADFS